MQITGADGAPLRGDLITSVILRTDLTPIPSTVEITAVSTRETVAALVERKIVKVGAAQIEYLLVRVNSDRTQGVEQGDREVAPIKAFGVLASCAALGDCLQRSIIREGSTFAEIYRSIGATAVVQTDFNVPLFGAFIGMVPTPQIAAVLQEEAAVVFLAAGKLQFRRIAELIAAPPLLTFPVSRTEKITSSFLEKHALPFIVSTSADGKIITSRREAARGMTFRPRADARILNNMGTVLVQRCKMREGLSPDLNAGARIDIDREPHIVITAAHVRATNTSENGAEEYTQLWLGQMVR